MSTPVSATISNAPPPKKDIDRFLPFVELISAVALCALSAYKEGPLFCSSAVVGVAIGAFFIISPAHRDNRDPIQGLMQSLSGVKPPRVIELALSVAMLVF